MIGAQPRAKTPASGANRGCRRIIAPQGPGFWLHQKAVRTLKPLQGKYDWAGIHPLLRQLIKIRLGQI